MIGYRNEHTIATSCEVAGTGYWSGQDVCVRFHPAPISTGIIFVRTDLAGRPECPATSEFADGVRFRTNLVRGDAKFEMIEHLMAALAGLEIDNCIVESDACEMPGLDGSCNAFVHSLQSAGLVIQATSKPRLVITEVIRVESEGAFVEAMPSPNGALRYSYFLDYGPDSCIRPQSFEINGSPRAFVRQVAPARTFVTLEQAEQLRASGVARHVTNQELLVIGDCGVVDNELRFRNECARHKTLDLIGDLSLAGLDLVGQFHSHRGGHRLNGMLANQLASLAKVERSVTMFQQKRNAA